MEQTTAHLRKQFQYDSDSESNSLPEAIDEEEQAQLINNLSAQNSAQNKIYTKTFIILPLLSALPYVHLLYTDNSIASIILFILALSSLGASTYILSVLPPGVTGMSWLDDWMMGSLSGDGPRKVVAGDWKGKGKRRRMEEKKERLEERVDGGLLGLYLPLLNLALVGFCAILGVAVQNEGGEGSWIGTLPGMVYGIICVVKGLMGSVDVEGLDRLRYGYKGA